MSERETKGFGPIQEETAERRKSAASVRLLEFKMHYKDEPGSDFYEQFVVKNAATFGISVNPKDMPGTFEAYKKAVKEFYKVEDEKVDGEDSDIS
jgi:hypothetical protein